MTAHAKLGASSAKRWMTCPGSVALIAKLPVDEDGGSVYAHEGSAAHALGEICLLRGDAPFEYLEEPHPIEEFEDVTLGTDLVDAVDVYTRHIWAQLGRRKVKREMVEQRVSLEKLGDWAKGMFGTADFVWYDASAQVLHVNDYKHGMGVAVEVEGNPQLKYYAVGALLAHDLHSVKALGNVRVRVTIIQPRKPHEDGAVRSVEYTAQALMDWAEGELRQAVAATREPDAPLVPSEDACRFCDAKGICPALANRAMEDAMLEFDGEGQVTPQVAMDKLTPEQIARILDNEKAIKDWLAGVATLAQNALQHGEDITGGRYKLVAGRSSRNWQNDDVAASRLASLGFDDDDIYSRKLLTPAQAEKLVGKEQKKALEDLIDKQDGKPALAPADDKRPALTVGPEEDFQ